MDIPQKVDLHVAAFRQEKLEKKSDIDPCMRAFKA